MVFFGPGARRPRCRWRVTPTVLGIAGDRPCLGSRRARRGPRYTADVGSRTPPAPRRPKPVGAAVAAFLSPPCAQPPAPRMPRPFRRGEPASRHRVAVCRSGHSVCLLVIPSWSPESLWGADKRRRDLGTMEETFLGSNPGASVPFVPSFTARPALNRTRRLLLPSFVPAACGRPGI